MTITQLVEIGFDDGPLVPLASVSWSDVTADLRSWSSMRGRTSELSSYAPGTATAVFDNRARAYDPTNTAGSYYGKLLPRRRIRRTLTVGATSAVVFCGFIQGYSLEYPEVGLDATCTITAVDGFDVLATRPLPGSAYSAEVLADNPINYWPLQDAAGSRSWVDVVDPTADLAEQHVNLFPSATSTASAPIGETTHQEGYRTNTSTSLTTPAAIEYWISSDPTTATKGDVVRGAAGDDFFSAQVVTSVDEHSQKSSYVLVRYSHGGKTDSTGAGTNIPFPMPAGDTWHLCVTADGTYLKVYINGRLVGTDTLAAGSWTYAAMVRASVHTQSGGGVPIAHVACYATAPSAARIAAHYEAGLHAFGHPYGDRAGSRIGRILDAIDWPSADRDLSTGSTVLGQWLPASGNALDACRAVETVEQGAFFISAAGKPTLRSRNDFRVLTRCSTSQATFGDDPAETPIDNPLTIDGNHIDYLRNLVTVTYAGGSVTAQDTTSRTAYGDLDDTVTATLLPAADGWTARQLANYRLRLRKTPISRVSTVTPQVLASDTVMATLIPLELCDRVTVNRRPTGGSGSFSQACHLQGIRSSWTPQAGHKWQGYLAPAIPSAVTAGYMIVGDATYGITGSTVTSY